MLELTLGYLIRLLRRVKNLDVLQSLHLRWLFNCAVSKQAVLGINNRQLSFDTIKTA
jgi:hypothetical protein